MSLYSTLYRQVLWPGYETFAGRHTHALLRQAEERQWWPSDKLRDWQQAELQRLINHARSYTPWYQSLPPQVSVADFRELPVLTKSNIRQHRTELLATNYRNKVLVHKTGGSTGEPLTFYMTRESYEWRNAMMLRGYGWAGAHEGIRQFFVWGGAVGAPSLRARWKSAAHDAVLRRKMFNCFHLDPAMLPVCLAALNRFQPRVLIGYTSMLEYFARYLQAHGGLRVQLHGIITAAEGVHAAQRQLLQDAFQAPVFASYGSREFKLIAMECERGGLHLSADNLFVEIIRDNQPVAPGTLGQVVITDLHNYGMPFLRYEIGDVAAPRPGLCPCGRGLPMLAEVHGRVADIIQSPSGKVLTGLFFPHLLKEFSWIEQYQVIQKELDRVLLKVVCSNPPAAERELPRLKSEVSSVLGTDMRLDIEFVDVIPRNATGKHRAVISEIPVQI